MMSSKTYNDYKRKIEYKLILLLLGEYLKIVVCK